MGTLKEMGDICGGLEFCHRSPRVALTCPKHLSQPGLAGDHDMSQYQKIDGCALFS